MKYQYRHESNLAYFWRKHGGNEWVAGIVSGVVMVMWFGYLIGMALDK